MQTYTVKSGDSLSAIAQRLLGDYMRYDEIMRLNSLTSTTIHPGQVLKIPASAPAASYNPEDYAYEYIPGATQSRASAPAATTSPKAKAGKAGAASMVMPAPGGGGTDWAALLTPRNLLIGAGVLAVVGYFVFAAPAPRRRRRR